MPASGAIVQSISQTKGGIGYIGLAYMNKSVKSIKVSYDAGKTFVEPTVANAKNETYPIVRALYYYYTTNSEAIVKPFIDYVLSPAGQKTVSEIGFITLN
jgi:phosphate transport system substrate-binding protein